MREAIEQAIDDIYERMVNLGVREGTRYSYYQGKIDGMRDCLDALDQEQL